jgi:hypothetical protein
VARIAVAGAATLVALGIVEALVRTWLPQPTYAIVLAPWGFEHMPGMRFLHATESGERVATVRYNAEGFRAGREYAIDAPPGTLRVAILGDSFGEGAEVEESDVHASRLERTAAAELARGSSRYRDVEVINAGVYAHDVCQQLRLFERRVLKYRPDVVFLVYTGRLEDNRRFCRLDAERLAYVDLGYTRTDYLARYVASYVKAKSHLVTLALGLARQRAGLGLPAPRGLERLEHRPLQPDSPRGSDRSAIDTYLRPRAGLRPAGEDDRLLAAIVDRLHERVTGYGGTLYVAFSHDPPERSPLAGHLAERRVASLDLHAYMADHRQGPIGLPVDRHWNEHGHALVARAFFEVLRRRHL